MACLIHGIFWRIFTRVNAEARRTLAVIQQCIADERYVALPHFTQRMDQRGLMWPEVLSLIDDPTEVRADGRDEWSRPRWIVSGRAADGMDIEIVCVLEADENGNMTVLITIYWQE